MRIKVCGMKYDENSLAVSTGAPDYMGFIFYPGSPRCAIDTLDAKTVKRISQGVSPIGVFVNESIEQIISICKEYGISFVQLHGDETPAFCVAIRESHLRIIKAFQIDEEFSFAALEPYASLVDLFLFDTRSNQRGGSGRKFDWSLLDKYKGGVPFILSGGISSTDVEAVSKIRHPSLHGIDINSQFETSPGFKDVALVSEFIKNLHDELPGQ